MPRCPGHWTHGVSGQGADSMANIRAKKSLGQNFLVDGNIIANIVKAADIRPEDMILEIGPGRGALTSRLVDSAARVVAVEWDRELVALLRRELGHHETLEIIHGDILRVFLKSNLSKLFSEKFSIIGNFPYNISSQIFFKVLDYKEQVPEVVCMIQKEVAERIAAPPGSKTYGILSVLLQAWYDIEFLFTVGEGAFVPPPKVKSAVIRLTRNDRTDLGCDEILFKSVVKTAFNQRRKTLRNSLKPLITGLGKLSTDSIPFAEARPEQLSVEEFITLTQILQQ